MKKSNTKVLEDVGELKLCISDPMLFKSLIGYHIIITIIVYCRLSTITVRKKICKIINPFCR